VRTARGSRRSTEGEQRRLLNGLGCKWGCRVREGYLNPAQTLLFLMQGASRMKSWRAGEPWDMVEVQDCLRAAILRGALQPAPAGASWRCLVPL
jgi:hypothetical protein